MAVVTITLYVNTGSITQNTIDANSNFGQSRDITNANYTVAVTAGDTVVWKGVSSSNPTTDVVKISEIRYKSGVDVLGIKIIKGDARGQATGTVGANTKGQTEAYGVLFTVYNNNVLRGSYLIDPKLKVNS